MGALMNKWEHNYLVHDEFGIERILCMACGNPIKSRQEMRSSLDQGKIIRDMAKHAEYREIPVYLNDGNIAFIMVCEACRQDDITPEVADKISNQLLKALRSQLEFEGKTEEVIEAVLKETTRKIIRKAEVNEVAKAMKGAI
jgi:hypothetical protein